MDRKIITAVMPIKLNNERLPGKNLKTLLDKPLLRYGLDSLLATGMMDSVNVLCSDDKVKAYLPNGVTFLKRPEYLDLPDSNFSKIFEYFMNNVDSDIYVYSHATAPFVTVETIKSCVNAVVSGEYDSAFCARKLQDYLWLDGEPLNFDASNLPRTQDLPPVYQETSGVYVFTKEVFMDTHRRVGKKPFIKEVSYKEAVDIDYPEDFKLAEALVCLDL